MNNGDRVIIVKSPYKSVKRGTVTTIRDCYGHKFGTKCNMYVLEAFPTKYFRENELALLPKEEIDENIPTSS